jgi:hypothetical protein
MNTLEILRIADPILALGFFVFVFLALACIWGNTSATARHMKAIRKALEKEAT